MIILKIIYLLEVNMDRNKLQNLIVTAIGPRTQKSFAALCGMTPQYLNRLLHSDSVIPTADTLLRIANHALGGVTFGALCRACGYDPSSAIKDESNFSAWEFLRPQAKTDYVSRALKRLNKIWFGLEGEYQKAIVFPSIAQAADEIASALSQMLETGEDALTCEAITNPDGTDKSADFGEGTGNVLFPVVLLWEEPLIVCRHKFMIRAIPAAEGKWAVVSLDLSRTHLKEVFAGEIDPASDDPSDPASGEHDPDSLYTEIFHIGVEADSAKALLRNIFGDTDNEISVPTFEEGIGFYVPDIHDPEIRRKVQCFFTRHSDMIPENAGNAETLYSDYKEKDSRYEGSSGTFGLAAKIMRDETGFHFWYEDNKEFPENRPCIMFPSEFFCCKGSDGPNGVMVKKSLLPYAEELGVKKIGTVWVRYSADLPKDPETDVPDNAERIEEAKRDFAEN